MNRFLIVLAFFVISFSGYGQINYSIINGLALIGGGDYRGYHFGNALFVPVVTGLYIKPSVGIIISSNSNPRDPARWHNVSYIDFKLPVLINPIRSERFGLFLGGGLSSRIRNEILPWAVEYGVDQFGIVIPVDIYYHNINTFDIGYAINLSLVYYTKRRVNYGLTISMDTYDKGTQIFSINFLFNFKLN